MSAIVRCSDTSFAVAQFRKGLRRLISKIPLVSILLLYHKSQQNDCNFKYSMKKLYIVL